MSSMDWLQHVWNCFVYLIVMYVLFYFSLLYAVQTFSSENDFPKQYLQIFQIHFKKLWSYKMPIIQIHHFIITTYALRLKFKSKQIKVEFANTLWKHFLSIYQKVYYSFSCIFVCTSTPPSTYASSIVFCYIIRYRVFSFIQYSIFVNL